MRRGVKAVAVAATGLVSLGAAGVASAFWGTSSTGMTSTVSSSVLGAPTLGASTATSSKVTIAVTAAGTGPTPTSYRVARTAPSAVTTVCTITGATGRCDDAAPVSGSTDSYSVYPVLGTTGWEGLTPATTSVVVPSGDTTAPNAPVITFPVSGKSYNAGGWTGSITGTASDNTGGSGVQKSQVAVQQISSGKFWSGTGFTATSANWMDATGTTSWSSSFARPADGAYSVQARTVDAANNTGVATTSMFSIDTNAPTTPSVNVPSYVNAATATAVAVTGTAEANTSVAITVRTHGVNGKPASGSATADGSGNWSTTVDVSTLTDGTLDYSVTAADSAGNVSGAGTAADTKDVVAPSAPSLSLTTATDTGSSSIDGVTRNATPTFTGSAEPGATVTLFNGSTSAGSAAADSTGTFSITPSALADNTYSFTARAKDAAGNTSLDSAAKSVTIDTVSPAAPTGLTLTTATDSGSSNNDGVTKNTSPTFTGAAEANSSITLVTGSTTIGTGSASSTGTITAQVSPSLTDGTYSVTAKATDLAGNTSVASTGVSITIDTVAPGAPTGLRYPDPTNGVDTITGSSSSGVAVATATETSGPHVGTVYTDSAPRQNGGFTITVDNVSSGSLVYSVTVSDAAGNASAATSFTVTDTR